MIVNLHNSRKLITELMSEYGVAKATLYKWINLYSTIEIANRDVTTNAKIIKRIKFIDDNKMIYNIKLLCKCLKVPRSVYYYHQNHKTNSYCFP